MSVPYGSGRNTKGMQTLSLAECELDQTLRRLFGFRRDDGSISPGLIEQAKESAMFVDEAHHPEDSTGARAALLRVLEAGTYYPVGSDKAEKVDNVLWLFASSRDLAGPNSIGNVPPPDFWTRMSHVVQVRHPLNATALRQHATSAPEERTKEVKRLQRTALKWFFCFFWISSLEKYFEREIVEIPPPAKSPPGRTPGQIVVDRKLRRLLSKLDEMADKFAEVLMQEAEPRSLHEISVRGLRSMANQLLSHAIRAVEEHEDGHGKKKSAAYRAVEKNLPEVFEQLRQVASLAPKHKS